MRSPRGNRGGAGGREHVVDCLLAMGVVYAVALPAVAFFFAGIVRHEPLRHILKSHLGPCMLLRVPWLGWGGALAFLAPFGALALASRRALARGFLPVLCGILVLLWLAVGAFLTLVDAVIRAGV